MPLDASSITAPPLQPQTAPNAAVSRDFPPTPFEVVLRYLETVKKDKVTFKEIEENCGDYAAEVMAYVASMLGALPLPGVVNAAGAALLGYVGQIPANNGGVPMPKKKRGKFNVKIPLVGGLIRFIQKYIQGMRDVFGNHENSVEDLKKILVSADLFYRSVTTWEPAEKAKLKQEHWQKDDWRWKIGLFALKIDAWMLIIPGFLLNNSVQGGAAMIKLAALNKRSSLGLAVGVLGTLSMMALQVALWSSVALVGQHALSGAAEFFQDPLGSLRDFSVQDLWKDAASSAVNLANNAVEFGKDHWPWLATAALPVGALGLKPVRGQIGQIARRRLKRLGYEVPTFNA